MAVATAAAPTLGARTHSPRRRLLIIVAGAAAAALIWAVAVPATGGQLLVRFGSGAPQAVSLEFVLAGSLTAPLLGWALLAWLERRTSQARTVWTRIAALLLLVSFALPLAAGISTSTKLTLLLMHGVVGSVVIVGLRQS
ncbi:MAG: hypothetical protein JOY68_00675 [Candidatus Dormibacteraeota bacterium]|nr:hypothetical protein [Candidatus Dormibacteraeota bacterium]MBV8445341.1 hypothetical protein [Candidatus Dormibacteraeota bacterium]